MRKYSFYLSSLFLIIFSFFPLLAFANNTPVILQALEEELDRSREGLTLDVFGSPYFLSYLVKDTQKAKIQATYGAILKSSADRSRNLYIEAKVGDMHSDSSNADLESVRPPLLITLPIEDDLDALKKNIWLATDREYKTAVLKYLRKKGKNIQKVEIDNIDDFSMGEKNVHIEAVREYDNFSDRMPSWKNIIRKTSAAFKLNKEIINSRVDFSANSVIRYYLNSEGSKIVNQKDIFSITLSARTKSKDGMNLFDQDVMYFQDPENFPTEEVLREKVLALTQSMMEIRESEVMEPYVGPAILAPDAAGVLFHEAIGHRLEGERQRSEQEGKTFRDKIDESILPDFISIYDDPSRKEYNNIKLSGHYRYDEEGQIGQKVVLVENGVLKNFLLSRTPIKNFPKTNGHGRSDGLKDPMARMSNLIVKSDREVSLETLKDMLIEEARKQNKPYGLLIKKVVGGETNTSKYNFQVFKGKPVFIYKVYVDDGRLELMRGAEFVGTPLASINKIKATGNDYQVFNGFCGAESGFVPVSNITSSVLLSEIELQRTSTRKTKPPILSRPAFSSVLPEMEF